MYLIIYINIIVFSIILIKGRKGKKIKISYMVIIAFLLGLYSMSLSKNILVDRQAYEHMFMNRFPIENTTLVSIFKSTIEPGFIFLNLIINKITSNVNILFFVITSGTILIDLIIITKLEKDKQSGIVIYLLSLQMFFGTYLCRQIIAVAIINIAILFYINNKKLKAYIFIGLATMFHTTAIVMIIVFMIIYRIKFTRKKIVIAIILSICCIFTINGVMNEVTKIEFFNRYLGDLMEISYSYNITIVLKGLPYHLIMIYSFIELPRIMKNCKNANVYIGSVIINSICWILSFKMYWLYRISIYVLVPSILLFPYILEEQSNKKKKMFYKYSVLGSLIFITLREIFITIY